MKIPLLSSLQMMIILYLLFSTLQIVVIFVMETQCVFCEVQTKVLSIITDGTYASRC
jgi:hypothetical protein